MFTLRYVIQNSLGGGTASELYSLALTLARFEATADWRRQLRDSTRADDSGTCDDQPAWLLTVVLLGKEAVSLAHAGHGQSWCREGVSGEQTNVANGFHETETCVQEGTRGEGHGWGMAGHHLALHTETSKSVSYLSSPYPAPSPVVCVAAAKGGSQLLSALCCDCPRVFRSLAVPCAQRHPDRQHELLH